MSTRPPRPCGRGPADRTESGFESFPARLGDRSGGELLDKEGLMRMSTRARTGIQTRMTPGRR